MIVDPKLKTKVVHSKRNAAWNVVGTTIPGKFKIARCPYIVVPHDPELTYINKYEAKGHADFISHCFNNSKAILEAAPKKV